MDRPACRHCGRNRAAFRKRGLCWTCYQQPATRAAYPSLSPHGRRGPKLGRKLPEPTASLPGTPERLAVLAARVASGQRLFHPEDATWSLA